MAQKKMSKRLSLEMYNGGDRGDNGQPACEMYKKEQEMNTAR